MDHDNELEFVSTSCLVKELQNRTDDMLIIASTNRTQAADSLLFGATGSLHGCLGLIEAAKMMLMEGGTTGKADDEDPTA